MKSYRLNRLFNAKSKRCFDVAVDHGFFNEGGFLKGIEDIEASVATLVEADPDAIQLTIGQAPILQSIPGKAKPALVLRSDVANVYGTDLPEHLFSRVIEDAAEQAVRLDAACLVVNLFNIPGEPEVTDDCIQNILDHNRKVMPALHLFLGGLRHAVVAQIIKTKFGVGAVGDIARVHFAALGRRLVVLNDAHGEPEKFVNRAHPFRVTRGKVIIHRDHVHAAPGERIQINRQRGHQRFAFARGHFRDAASVQRVTADELYVEGNHLPQQIVPAHLDVAPAQPTAGILHHRERLGHQFLQPRRQLFVVIDGAQLLFPLQRFSAQ